MASKKAQVELEQLKLDQSVIRWRYVSAILLTLIRWAGVVGFMYLVYRTVDSLAGKQTSADIAISGGLDLKFLANRYASQIIFGLFGGGGVLYGLRQKRLYKKATDKLRRVEKYERQLDSNRSSSGLDDGSQPNPEDIL